MVHYYDHIRNFGSPNGLCSSITESKHIAAVKRPWRRSNKHTALPQMLKINERLDKIAAARIDFTTRGMLVDSCLVQAIEEAFAKLIPDEDPMDESSDSDGTDSEFSDVEFQTPPSHHSNIPYARRSGNINTSIPDGTYEDADDHTMDLDDDAPQPLPTLPNDEEDDDCGPVESGPLMNEVRLVGRKGMKLRTYRTHELKYFLQHPRGSTLRHLMH